MFSSRLVALSLTFVIVGFACLTQAQVPMTGAGLGKPAAGAGYTGPGDISSGAISWGSCGRAYTAAFAATAVAICDLVDTATGASSCTLKIGTDGKANLTGNVCVGNTVSVTTFCTVTVAACSITKVYDQTGTGNHLIQATLSLMPGFTLNASNSLPGMTFDGVGDFLVTAGAVSQNQPYVFSTVTKLVTGISSTSFIMSATSPVIFFADATPKMALAAGGSQLQVTTGIALDTFIAMNGLFSGSSSNLNINGTSHNSTAAGTDAMSSGYAVGSFRTGSLSAKIVSLEFGVWPSDISSNFASISTNQHTAWSF